MRMAGNIGSDLHLDTQLPGNRFHMLIDKIDKVLIAVLNLLGGKTFFQYRKEVRISCIPALPPLYDFPAAFR
jgi:hypothetical protein